MKEMKMTSEITANSKLWDDAFNAGNIEELSTYYVENASVLPAGGAPVNGATAIGAFFRDIQSKGLTEHHIVVHDLVTRGDTAIAIGTWSLSGSDETGQPVKFGGNWVNVLGRQDKGWKILLHTWN
jgi:ketosteroid isomerase-like protein